MKKFLFLALLFPLYLKGAVGDTTIQIAQTGFDGYLYVNSGTTNGTFSFNVGTTNNGIGTNYVISGQEKLIFTVQSPGNLPSGATSIVYRTVYGTFPVRFPWSSGGAQNFPDVTISGSDAKARFALSSYIGSDDIVTAELSAGVYMSSGATNNAASGLAVTNSSSQPYGQPDVNFSQPGEQKIQGSTVPIRLVGFSRWARQGEQLPYVQVIAADEHGVSNSVIVTNMSLDTSLSEYLKSDDYIAEISTNGFTAGDRLRIDFIAKPWVGNAASTLDTTLNLFRAPGPVAITNLFDPGSNYAPGIAVVDPSFVGNDPNGQITNVSPSLVLTNHYFQSIGTAMAKMRAYNNVNGSPTHNDPGGGRVCIRTVNTPNNNWMGGTNGVTYGTSKVWVEVGLYPGDTGPWVITNRLNDRNPGHFAKLSDVKINGVVDPAVPFSATHALWFQRAVFDAAGATQPIQNCTNVYITDSYVTNWPQGLKAVSSQNTSMRLLRNIQLDGFNDRVVFFTAIGLYKLSTNGGNIMFSNDGAGAGFGMPGPDHQIFYNFYLAGLKQSASTIFSIGDTLSITNGLSIVQGVLEYATNNIIPNVLFLSTPNTLVFTNVNMQYVTVVGKRGGLFYSDTGANIGYKTLSSVKWSNHEIPGFKTDDFVGSENGARIGNWPVIWGTDFFGNVWNHVPVDQAAGAFHQVFAGLNCYDSSGTLTNTFAWPRYVNRATYDGVTNAPVGGGNYRLLSDSPLFLPVRQTKKHDFGLKHALDGNNRGLSDGPSPYADGNVIKSGMISMQ